MVASSHVLVTLLVMVMVVTAVDSEEPRPDAEVLYQDHFPPLHTNCTQSLTDLLQLRQEAKLTGGHENNDGNPRCLDEDYGTHSSTCYHSVTCTSPMRRVGGGCVFLALWERLSWSAARQYCAHHGGDLAVFPDANTYADVLRYINEINSERTEVSVWLGGTDQTVEGVWLWVAGDPMPRGPPFWGYVDNYRSELSGGKSQNCAVLYYNDHYIHDTDCSATCAPLCQL